MVRNSTIANNGLFGLIATGSKATIRVTHSMITGNGTGLAAGPGGTLESFGDNALRGNTINGVPTSTVALQ